MARKLKPIQYRAAQMIARGEPDDYITDKLKLRRNTLKRWRRVPEFYQAVQDVVEDMQLAAKYKLSALKATSVDALHSDIFWGRGTAAELKQKVELLDYCRNLPEEAALKSSESPQAAPNESELNLK